MKITKLADTIVLEGVKDFLLQQTFDCGQCFRWDAKGDKVYEGVAYGRYLLIRQLDKETIELYTTQEDFNAIWYDYFDLGRDYGEIKNRIRYDEFLRKASEYGWGIRILKQEPWETLCSFIISQRNSIPKIKKTIKRLCTLFGDEIKLNNMTSYAFPTPEQILTRAGIRGLISIGLGYRAHYVYRVAELISSGKYNLEILKLKSKDEAEQELLKLYGVGPKVANCTLLFGLGHVDAFPIDVWIQRIISEVYNGYLDISPFKGVAGIVQQYMFYYMRTSYYNR